MPEYSPHELEALRLQQIYRDLERSQQAAEDRWIHNYRYQPNHRRIPNKTHATPRKPPPRGED